MVSHSGGRVQLLCGRNTQHLLAKMADSSPLAESPVLMLAEIVRFILATLRLMALVLEHAAQILDSSMQHVAATEYPSSEPVGSPRPATPETRQPCSVYTDIMPSNSHFSTVAVADSVSSGVQEQPDTTNHTRHPPVPIFCDPKSKSHRFYCVTVGRLVGVFDSR